MSDYKLTFKLKQHTPIIHFQHDQHGATLRASELKPKLDKFLIKNFFGGILNFDAYKEFLIGDTKGIEKELKKIDADSNIGNKESEKTEFLNKQKLAFDYKVKIIADHSVREIVRENPLFLGNMGKGNSNKYKYTDQTNISLEIIIFKEQLTEKINKNLINEFFATNNFGNRNGKGNGSIYIDERDKLNYLEITSILPKGTFYMEVPTKDVKKLYDVINYYWKGLKSGINYTKDNCKDSSRYKKSYLYKYYDAQKPSSKWGKKYIKEHFFSVSYKNKNRAKNTDEFFERALLGLPDKFSFMRTNTNQCKPASDIKIETKIDISAENSDIERIKSPITFKPILKDNIFLVFILFNKDFKNLEIFEKEFFFTKPRTFELVTEINNRNGNRVYKSEKINTDQTWEDFTKTNEYSKASNLQDNYDNRIKFQLKDLEFILTIPNQGNLSTPSNKIDLNDLITSYHKYAQIFKSNEFTPMDFRWNKILEEPVKIKTI